MNYEQVAGNCKLNESSILYDGNYFCKHYPTTKSTDHSQNIFSKLTFIDTSTTSPNPKTLTHKHPYFSSFILSPPFLIFTTHITSHFSHQNQYFRGIRLISKTEDCWCPMHLPRFHFSLSYFWERMPYPHRLVFQ